MALQQGLLYSAPLPKLLFSRIWECHQWDQSKMKTEGLNVGDNEQQAKKKCLRDTETVTVNPAGDKKFYEQGGFKGYPQLYSQNQTHGGKKTLYAHFPFQSLFRPGDISYYELFQKKRKIKKVRMDCAVKPRASPLLDMCQNLLCYAGIFGPKPARETYPGLQSHTCRHSPICNVTSLPPPPFPLAC